MNLLSKVLLFISCMLAFTTLLFFFQFVAVRAYNQDLIAQKEAFSIEAQKRARLAETQSARTQDAERMAQQAKNEARDHRFIAREFKAELERRMAESQIAQKESMARLNARLEREALARQKAEKEAEKYFSQKELLEHDLLMVWAEIESLKAAHNRKLDGVEKESQKKLKQLADEVERLKKELERAAEQKEKLSSLPPGLTAGLAAKDDKGKISEKRPSPNAEQAGSAPSAMRENAQKASAVSSGPDAK